MTSPRTSVSVGTSGNSGERAWLMTASALMCPLCNCGIMLDSASTATGVDPPSTAFTTSPPPRNGTRTMSAPVSRLSFSMKYASGNANVP